MLQEISDNKFCFIALFVGLFSATISNAGCYVTWNCGSSGQCAQLYGSSSGRRGPFASCSGYVQRDMVSSCSCSSTPSLPAGGDPAVQLGTQIGNQLGDLFIQSLTPQPKTPEQLEAERQAEIERQRREAKRQAKIQKYLDEQALKKQQKEADLDREAKDSLSLLDHKPAAVTMSDAELLGSNKGMAPSLCTEELRGISNDLNAFGAEAKAEGLKFTVSDAVRATGVGKVSTGQFQEDYKTLKGEIEKVKKEADGLAEIKKCVETKGCSLIALSKKYDQDFKEWLKGLSTQGLHEAADRVDKAAAFYTDYTKRLEQHNEKIMNGAVKCLAN
jgi:hypothetical protein